MSGICGTCCTDEEPERGWLPEQDHVKFDMLPPAEYVRRIEAGESLTDVQADMMDRIIDPWVNGVIMIDPSDAGATGVYIYMEPKENEVDDEVAQRQLKSYNKMISRETGGSDPLVQEPKSE